MTDLCPLIVEMNGALVYTDLAWEQRIVCFKHKIQKLTGKLVNNNAVSAEFNVENLPYSTVLISFLREEKIKGRTIILLATQHYQLATQIADYLQCFDLVLDGRDCHPNNIAEHLTHLYGEKGFDFVGHAAPTLTLSAMANQVFLIKPSASVQAYSTNYHNIYTLEHATPASIKDWLYQIRVHQWVKNSLVFVPLLTSHQIGIANLLLGFMAFLLFSCCSSSAYILNDLMDLANDRAHSKKCHRPLAAGKLAIKTGLFVCLSLLLIAMLSALILLPVYFFLVLVLYYGLTLAYSLCLKSYMAIDVVILAILYSLRIIAGSEALVIDLSSWILAFSMFIFLSLALIKRYTELNEIHQKGKHGKVSGRGYYPDDLSMIASLGAAAGYLSVMVLALYINSSQVALLYSKPQIIWLACPLLLFWVTRIWILAHRGQLHEDPVVFAIRDKVSLMTGIIFICVFGVAL